MPQTTQVSPTHAMAGATFELTHEQQIERTRIAVQAAATELEQLAVYERSRPLSLAITNAQQAAMWHGWHEGEQGRYVSPFPTADHA